MAPLAIPGAHQAHVITAENLSDLALGETQPEVARLLAWWQRLLLALAKLFGLSRNRALIRYWLPRGRQACVIGGDSSGLAAAQLLCGYGRKVSVVAAGPDFGSDMNATQSCVVLESLRRSSAVLINHSRVTRIDAGTLVLDCDGADIDIPADLVVLSEEVA